MKRKYYMRGLAVGIAVTTILFALFPSGSNNKMTDEQAIARAKELGYCFSENTVTKEALPKPTKVISDETASDEKGKTQNTPAATTEPQPTKLPETTSLPQPTKLPEATSLPQPTNLPTKPDLPKPPEEPEKPEQTEELLSITVEKGMGSQNVSQLLKKEGIIENADAFDRYLKENGLADRIRIGTFRIPKGTDFETIGNLLTK